MMEGIEVRPQTSGLSLHGELHRHQWPQLERQLLAAANLASRHGYPLQLEMEELDVPDAAALAALTRWLAQCLDAETNLELLHPPQLLMHSLYRIGRYPHRCLKAFNIREEEAYG